MPVDVLEYTSASMGANMMGMMNFVITCFSERESKSAYTHYMSQPKPSLELYGARRSLWRENLINTWPLDRAGAR